MSPGQRLGLHCPMLRPTAFKCGGDFFAQYNLFRLVFPSALMQHALADLEQLSSIWGIYNVNGIDDGGTQQMGYQLHVLKGLSPLGTFTKR